MEIDPPPPGFPTQTRPLARMMTTRPLNLISKNAKSKRTQGNFKKRYIDFCPAIRYNYIKCYVD